MSVTTMSKRSDVMAVATAEARELQKTRPELSLPAARAEVWMRRPDLAARFNELPFEYPAASESSTPVLKGGPAYQEATREAEDLMKRYPDRHRGVASARLEIYRIRPDLADRVSNEQMGVG